MNVINHPMPEGVGIGQLDRLSPNTSDRVVSNTETHMSLRRSHHVPTDDLSLSRRARSFIETRPIDLPPPGGPVGDGDLAASIRKVGQFLKEHPRMAESPFGKSVQTLMRGAVQLVKSDIAGDINGFPPDAKEKLLDAVRQVKVFLSNHPRVAESSFGKAVAKMGQAIVSNIAMDGGDPSLTLKDKVIHAAKKTHHFLEAHPKIAQMPLGQAAENLINGVWEMGNGNAIDPDIQNLAKRISHFVSHHPRLAESEFGQLVTNLTRGILALDTSIPQDVEPPVVGVFRPDVAVLADRNDMLKVDLFRKADFQKAA